MERTFSVGMTCLHSKHKSHPGRGTRNKALIQHGWHYDVVKDAGAHRTANDLVVKWA